MCNIGKRERCDNHLAIRNSTKVQLSNLRSQIQLAHGQTPTYDALVRKLLEYAPDDFVETFTLQTPNPEPNE